MCVLNIVRSDSNPHLMSCRPCLPSAVISANFEIVLTKLPQIDALNVCVVLIVFDNDSD